MDELASKNDIELVSMDLLVQAKALDVYPTPIERILRVAGLTTETSLDLSRIDPNYLLSPITNLQVSLSQVRGFLDRTDKTIYVDRNMLPTRQRFVTLHEIGHEALDWQNRTLQFLDDDSSISEFVREEFEMEANYFASTTLFQHDRFIKEMKKLGLGLKAGMDLAKKFGASNHSALRRMVDQSSERCALIVLEKSNGKSTICKLRDYFQSTAFTETFGVIDLPPVFDKSWKFYNDFYFNRKFLDNGLISIATEDGSTNFRYHFFNNGYNVFVFLIPRADLPLRVSKKTAARL